MIGVTGYGQSFFMIGGDHEVSSVGEVGFKCHQAGCGADFEVTSL